MLALGSIAVPAAFATGGSAMVAAPQASVVDGSNSASGIEIVDIDGTVLLPKTSRVTWTTGVEVTDAKASTGDVLKLNTTKTTGVTTTAGPKGASVSVDSATLTLRERVPVRVSGMRAVCAPDGTASVRFDSLTVDGADVTAAASATTGYSIDLPDSKYGPTKLVVGSKVAGADGRVSLTGLQLQAEPGASEIQRVTLGEVSCAASSAVDPPTSPEPITGPPAAVGVIVTAADGAPLIDGKPRATPADGTKHADALTGANGYPVSASNVTVDSAADGSAKVTIGEFRQVPDSSPIGEYLWSALRVYGLKLEVAKDGSSDVSFGNAGSAVFANGVWINTATDVYTGLDADGKERVLVHFNERTTNADGSTTITALHYKDLTGANPEVRLGQVTLVAATPTTPVDPADPGPPATVLPRWYSHGVLADGASVVAATPLAGAEAPKPSKITNAHADAKAGPELPSKAEAKAVTDGGTGQVTAHDITVRASVGSGSAVVGSVLLFPRSSIEISLSHVRTSVTSTGIVVTSGGGTVAGTPVRAGAIAPNTLISPQGTSLRIVLNEQTLTGSDVTVSGLRVNDPSGLGADIRVATVTTIAPAAPEPGTGEPGTGSPGHGQPGPSDPDGTVTHPGALSPDGTGPAGTSGTNRSVLARTGADPGLGMALAALLLAVGGAGIGIGFLQRRKALRDEVVPRT